MNKSLFVSLVLSVFMVCVAALTRYIIPVAQYTSIDEKFKLESMIPYEFDGWKMDQSSASLVINPDGQSLVNKLYSQTLSRTYINRFGTKIMLSIAYGKDQSSDLQVHRPELCYEADGFSIEKMSKSILNVNRGRIPVMQMVAKRGARSEPITYWIKIGNSLTRGWVEQKLAEIIYGLTGNIPNGLLFRISTISNDEQLSFQIQKEFLAALSQSVKAQDRFFLMGQE